MLQSQQAQFLAEELASMAWAGSVQRACLYTTSPRPSGRETEAFRRNLTVFVERELLPQYRSSVSPKVHLRNLGLLVAMGTQIGGSRLSTQGYKYGVAQKFLNLLLKYQWCLGSIPEPPHCLNRPVFSGGHFD